MTAHNFLLLCRRGYYNNTVFHRSIKNFMVRAPWTPNPITQSQTECESK
jgi:cyclophilin family peptidyl-prolyl cis-trans isomerase